MKYISVFSGIEAATVAWRPLGWEAIAFSEIEPFPCQVLKHHYPDVPNLGDISKVDWRQFLGTVDIVVGGSPCQSFSVAGSRTGLDGASGLVREYFRLLSECKPRWFLWENVPGVVSSNGGLDWIFILREWHKLGYNVSFRVLDAQYAGVPQRRRRIFAVGYLGDWRPPAKVLFEQYSLQRHPAPCREKRKNHTEGSEVCSYKAGGFGEWNEGIGTCRASRQGDETLVAKTLTAKNGYRLNAEDENLLVAKCLTSKNQRNDMETETLVYSIAGNTIDRQLQNGGNGAGFQEGISYTLNTVDRHAVAECYPIDLRSLGKIKKEDLPVGEEGSPAYTLTKSYTHGVAFCSDVSSTISASGPPFSRPGNDHVETEALVCQDPPLMPKDREGKPGGGKGLLIGEDKTFTLSCGQDQALFTTQKGVANASAQEGNASEILQILREKVGKEAFAKWGLGILDSLQSEEVLQQAMHGVGIRRAAREAGLWMDDCALPCKETLPEGELLDLWENGPDGRSPQGRELAQQLARKFNKALPLLPHERTSFACVRRLTPLEAERLQGFPDGYTNIPFKGKPAPDGARYKALGNSMAVPCMAWIGKRIQAVEDGTI